MTTGCPENASISRSLRLSPTAITLAAWMPSISVHTASVEPFEHPPAMTSSSEKSRAAYSVSVMVTCRGKRELTQVFGKVAHLRDAAGERDLDRVVSQGVFQRRVLGHEDLVAFIVATSVRVLPVDSLVDVLFCTGPIEDERGTGATPTDGLNDLSCRATVRVRIGEASLRWRA